LALICALTSVRARAARFHPASLDALNFLLADVRGALGPYLNVILVTQQHWSVAAVGLVTTTGGWLGVALQTPIGAAIDATRAKRALVVFALCVLAGGAMLIYVAPSFWPVMIANASMAMVGGVFGPAVAALTLGIYRRAELARRMARNGILMPETRKTPGDGTSRLSARSTGLSRRTDATH
jgi:MFS family permease